MTTTVTQRTAVRPATTHRTRPARQTVTVPTARTTATGRAPTGPDEPGEAPP
ncbi:hypothetical protein [Amycolatopsis sp. NPDC098790]|uniref:hypothetical protein n=1 Tax=Amycolatopsis sp. NPDC098790 TaxID=3363939 RepID=UPI0038026A19